MKHKRKIASIYEPRRPWSRRDELRRAELITLVDRWISIRVMAGVSACKNEDEAVSAFCAWLSRKARRIEQAQRRA